VAAPGFGDQVAVFNFPKYQISAPFPLRNLSVLSNDAAAPEKVGRGGMCGMDLW
jgi:hypothetical protein